MNRPVPGADPWQLLQVSPAFLNLGFPERGMKASGPDGIRVGLPDVHLELQSHFTGRAVFETQHGSFLKGHGKPAIGIVLVDAQQNRMESVGIAGCHVAEEIADRHVHRRRLVAVPIELHFHILESCGPSGRRAQSQLPDRAAAGENLLGGHTRLQHDLLRDRPPVGCFRPSGFRLQPLPAYSLQNRLLPLG